MKKLINPEDFTVLSKNEQNLLRDPEETPIVLLQVLFAAARMDPEFASVITDAYHYSIAQRISPG